MAMTNFGPLRSSSDTTTDALNGGWVLCVQTVSVTTVAGGTAVSGTITLPANAQIIEYYVDKTVLQSGGDATAYAVTVGTAAAGAQYMTSTDMVAATRATTAKTVAQLLAMSAIGTNTSVVLTVAPNGTVGSQGTFLLTVEYAQKV